MLQMPWERAQEFPVSKEEDIRKKKQQGWNSSSKQISGNFPEMKSINIFLRFDKEFHPSQPGSAC